MLLIFLSSVSRLLIFANYLESVSKVCEAIGYSSDTLNPNMVNRVDEVIAYTDYR